MQISYLYIQVSQWLWLTSKCPCMHQTEAHRPLSLPSPCPTRPLPHSPPAPPFSLPLPCPSLVLQMEFCENRTLRHLIDDSHLHCEDDTLWRLLREITEGLNHIHKQVRVPSCLHHVYGRPN